MAKPKAKPKSAMEVLVDSMMELRAEAKQRMTAEEFQEAERKFDELVANVRARRAKALKARDHRKK